jgi:hypothetical protein
MVMEKDYDSTSRQKIIHRFFVAQSPAAKRTEKRNAMFDPDFDQRTCFFDVPDKLLSTIVARLFTLRFSDIRKAITALSFLDLSTGVDNFVRNSMANSTELSMC